MQLNLSPALCRTALAALTFVAVLAHAEGATAQSVKVVTFGDSGPAGSGVSSSEAYPALLQAMLQAKGISATVQNISAAGDTTAMGLARVGSVPSDAQVVITEFGSNDLRAGVSTAEMNANMGAIVKRLRANGAQVLVMGTRGISYGGVAGQNGAQALTYPGSFKNYIQGTGKHLTPQGHQAAAAMLLPRVMAMIGKSKKKG
jgi:acyl-CoA thioesterase-1